MGCLGTWFLELASLTGAAPLSISLNFPQLSVPPYETNLVVVVLVMPQNQVWFFPSLQFLELNPGLRHASHSTTKS